MVIMALVIAMSSATFVFYVSKIVFIDTKQCSAAMQNICAAAATAPQRFL